MLSHSLYIAYKIAVAEQDRRRLAIVLRAIAALARWSACYQHREARPVQRARAYVDIRPSIHSAKYSAIRTVAPPVAA